MRECRTDPEQIIIEITETALAENPEETIRFARTMMEHGVKIEMDDFGTGYSNIDSVMHMPLSTVKLDRSLVVSAVENPRSATMTGYLIRVFHELGYEVLA
ncbi:MAG: EAL domain-containing protein, partial [Holdemania filiformis]